MPFYSNPITNLEKELIRQWVLFGAPATGTVVDEQILVDYYAGQGETSFPTPPPAPAPGEGFQIKIGPFYLAPAGQAGGELEYFLKYELDLPEDLEVDRLDIKMSGFSHHFILYNYTSQAAANNIPPGLRTESYHQDIGLFAAVQEATDLDLPQGTAFFWDKNLVLDLNSHYINYLAGLVYQAEAYVNVYTQPAGSAAQEMQTTLLANTNIYIPNNGDLVTKTQVINYNLGEVYLWGMMGHTHKYGEGYKVYERVLGTQGDLIYNGACPQGIPDCVSPFFDYQHIPMRYFEPLRPVVMNTVNGLIHEASWINDGPDPVWFGPTSSDEMMVLVMMYTLDSTGVVIAGDGALPPQEAPVTAVNPNPVQDQALLTLPDSWGNATFRLYNAAGVLQREVKEIHTPEWTFERGDLSDGIYFFRLEDASGQYSSGKLVLQR
ncbi:MAG: T9SS type A sorting domain-containing protein [Saprospirales bacterium]|nr:T9SS type A sorting domain-containing protein [Saprospirales bacterium]